MKKITILTGLMLVAYFIQAQSVLRYEFLNSLNEKNGNGPALNVLGNQGVYVLDTLNEISGNTKTVYRFEQNSGFQFDNAAADNFIGNSYSIELYFVFDELSSWKRVVDWKNRKTDYGAYVYNGELNFYPYVYSNEAPVVPGAYTYYVITRDDATGQVLIYTDASVEIELMDSNGDALLDADNVLNFFQDDLDVPGEASSGAVALLNLYNYVIDSNTVKHNFNNLGGQVFSVGENGKDLEGITIYPNPAFEKTTIKLPGFKNQKVTVSIFSASGTQVFNRTIDNASNSEILINTGALAEGIYLVRAESTNNSMVQKLVVRK